MGSDMPKREKCREWSRVLRAVLGRNGQALGHEGVGIGGDGIAECGEGVMGAAACRSEGGLRSIRGGAGAAGATDAWGVGGEC